MATEQERNLGDFVQIPIWIDHPESDSHYIGDREDLDANGGVEVGPAILGTEEEYTALKNGGEVAEIIGNIFNLQHGIICHQVNCKGVMGAGLAKCIRDRWPQVYTDYMAAYKQGRLQLGAVIWTQVGDGLWVASLCGQDGYGRQKDIVYTNYDALKTCLLTVEATKVFPVAIPKGMSCTLANGDWATVVQIIQATVPHALIVNKTNQALIDSFAGEYHFLSNFSPSPVQVQLPATGDPLPPDGYVWCPICAGAGGLQHLGGRCPHCGIEGKISSLLLFPTIEHYYQAMKSERPQDWINIAKISTPGGAKQAGKKLILRPNWEQTKLEFMENGLRAKFQIPELKEKLLATGTAELVEGNYWNDTFWGVCKGVGENHLGKLLMKIRGELR
jgi:ribA/ribD-fused uncharacterized protein